MTSPARWYNQRRLRIIAGGSLAVAMVMLILGLSLAEPYLDPKGSSFWFWWGSVLLLVLIALAMAVLDMADLHRQRVAEQKELLKEHFDGKFLDELEARLEKQKTKKEGGEQGADKTESEK
jgi:hypothetical protein